MRLIAFVTVALLAASAPALAQHENHAAPPSGRGQTKIWTATPMALGRPAGRAEAIAMTANMEVDTLAVIAPDGTRSDLSPENTQARIKPKSGNYHLVLAQGRAGGGMVNAVSAVYFSNPGPAPSKILSNPPAGLMLLPERLPREHSHFRSGDSVRFRLTADGNPLPGMPVQVETANGTHQKLSTDLDGWVKVSFPADFPPVDQRPEEGHGRPLTAGFVASARLNTGAEPRLASFAYAYGPNPLDKASPAFGAGFALLGMAFALPLILRRKPKGAA